MRSMSASSRLTRKFARERAGTTERGRCKASFRIRADLASGLKSPHVCYKYDTPVGDKTC